MHPWVGQLQQAAAAVAGPQWLDETTTRWHAFADSPSVHLTFYGPYNAGKSTLLKRLLRDANLAVPDWLTIAGRPETFALNRVALGELTITDTPGVGGEHAEHDRAAAQSLALTDVVVYCTLPQVMATDAQHLGAIATGRLFAGEQSTGLPRPPGALLVVMGQADTLGADPDDDPQAFAAAVERKRTELLEMAGRVGAGVRPSEVFVVAADPFAMVGNSAAARDPATARWDGVPALTAALHGLSASRAVLREAAQLRYWALEGRQVLARVEQELARLGDVQDDLTARARQVDLVLSDIERLHAAVCGDLVAVITNALTSAIEESGPNSTLDALAKTAEERLGASVDRWFANATTRLAAIAQDLDSELGHRAQRPQGRELDSLLSEVLSTAGSRVTAVAPNLMPLADTLDNAVRLFSTTMFVRRFGVDPDALGRELEHIAQLREFDRVALSRVVADPSLAKEVGDLPSSVARHFGSGSALLTTEEAVQQATKRLHTQALIVAATPMVLELIGVVVGQLAAQRQEQAAADRGRHLAAAVPATAQQIADRIRRGQHGQGWDAVVDAARDSVRQRRPSETLVQTTRERSDALAVAFGRLTNLLQEPGAAT